MDQPSRTHVTSEQLASLRRVCERLSYISGASLPPKLDTFDELLNTIGMLSEICHRRVTRGRQDHAELRLMRDELEEVERLKSRFIRNVSHELRTPLASIEGFARAMLNIEKVNGANGDTPESAAAENRTQFLSIISQEAQRLGQFIEDVLELSEVESNPQPRQASVFTARELFDKSIQSFAKTASPPRIQLRLRPEPDGPPIYGEWSALVEVFRQLISNAHKFSKGAEIIAGADLVSIGPNTAPSSPESGLYQKVTTAVRLYVKDNGIGIAREELERIFDKFYRQEGADSYYPGTGLGLSIVRAIVTKNNGHVWAESNLGQGSTFFVILPTQS